MAVAKTGEVVVYVVAKASEGYPPEQAYFRMASVPHLRTSATHGYLNIPSMEAQCHARP